MAKWKLSRLIFGKEEFIFSEGDEVTIGRGVNNKIILSSLLISRNHCILNAKENEVFLTDLKSSNGIFVGTKKIPANTPTKLKPSDIIGFGLTTDSSFPNVEDDEKYLFKLTRDDITLADRIVFQNEDEIEEELFTLENGSPDKISLSPVIDLKQNLKRKIDQEKENILVKNESVKHRSEMNIVLDKEGNMQNHPSHSNTKPAETQRNVLKKIKLDIKNEDPIAINSEANREQADLELEPFSIKREYLDDDEPIQIDSDSDSESEQWRIRLSQNSPGKPFIKSSIKSRTDSVKDYMKEENSYSQVDDEIDNNIIHNLDEENEDEVYMTDLISIPPPPPDYDKDIERKQDSENEHVRHDKYNERQQDFENEHVMHDKDKIEIQNLNISEVTSAEQLCVNKNKMDNCVPEVIINSSSINEDQVDGFTTEKASFKNEEAATDSHIITEPNKIQLILPQPLAQRRISKIISPERHTKTSSRKSKKTGPMKKTFTDSQKEERKRKLKAIAEKNREQNEQNNIIPSTSNDDKKGVTSINIKVTNTNRSMKMTEFPPDEQKDSKSKTDAAVTNKSLDNKSKSKKERDNDKVLPSESKAKKGTDDDKVTQKIENKLENKSKIQNQKVHPEIININKDIKISNQKSKHEHEKVPVKSLQPFTDSEEYLSGKPLSKVYPLPQKKTKKSVRFSEAAPEVREFEIEPGNRMRKTSLIKTTLVDVQHMPVFSLEKLTLMKVLRWNPKWLVEQVNQKNPPPILGHENEPTALFHTFHNHNQYVQQVGDLLLMEVWESLSLAYEKIQSQHTFLTMRIASLPPVPPPERYFDIFNIGVDISLPNTELKNLPKAGDVLLVSFGCEAIRRFFYVYNVRCIPSPPRNIHSFYNLTLHATFTQKMRDLKPGEMISALNLGHINKEMNLFEAMAYMATSPLSEAILRPEPRHFVPSPSHYKEIKSPWTMTLNESQQRAVTSSVAAALGDKPCIQMIQGPPGTGKSSVICSIVMTYFFDEHGNRHQNRGKILICATSNAAVDGLVLKLLKIRQSLPKPQRFRMVRVGRPEAMHERARDLSSQQLAARDAQRPPAAAPGAAAAEEISLLNAKINKWKTLARDAKDPVRVAYCEGRVKDLEKRKTLLSGGGGGGGAGEAWRPEQLAAERRIVEGADIIATTLASVHNHKMRGLKRRIALCIVDEAGQAIEPEALLPLTLDVAQLTLVGDPQQLPGYICSQRAKQLGLGESLFSRLSSCAEAWPRADGERAVQLLRLQYRMHAAIADYPNRAFYGARVRDRPPPRPALPVAPYAVLGVASGDKGQGARGENEMEAWAVARVALALSGALRRAAHAPAVAVLTPYQAQREAIRRKLRTLADPAEGEAGSVEVSTVDSFQGQERDVVVVSLARAQGMGFVADAGRMNVLLTRARHALLVCLNPRAVQSNPQWRTLLEDAQRRNLYRALPNRICQPAGPISDEDILSYISNPTNSHRSNR